MDTSIAAKPLPASNELASLATLKEIPIIDIGRYLAGQPGAINEVAGKIRHACEKIGFFFITHHGVQPKVVDGAFGAMAEFFQLPASVKATVKMNKHQCGWEAPNSGFHRDSFDKVVKPNATEAFKFGRELDASDPDFGGSVRFRGHNQWPTALSAASKQKFLSYYDTFDTLAKKLLAPLAVSLDLPADYFDRAFEPSSSVMRSAYYPVMPLQEGQLGLPGHTDLSMLTLIPPATAPGLQILTADGTWIDQPAIPNAILVNTGNTLRTWVNDRYIATPHRVLPSTDAERYSAIFFLYPHLDAELRCVETCKDEDRPEKYPPIKFSDFYAGYAARNFSYAEQAT